MLLADRSRLTFVIFLLGVIIAIGAVWRFSALSEYTEYNALMRGIASVREHPAGPLMMVALFVGGGLLFFPVSLLIVATAAVLGPWLGLASATAGVLASASLVYLVGRAVGLRPLSVLLGSRLERVKQRVARDGFMTILVLRMIPFAPFSVINVAAGASGIRFADFILGTALGMAPVMIAMTIFGAQLSDLVAAPTLAKVPLVLACLIGWLAVSFAIQRVLSRTYSPG